MLGNVDLLKMPLVRAVIPLIAGVVIANNVNPPPYLLWVALISFFGLILLAYTQSKNNLLGISLLVFFIFSGIQLAQLNDDTGRVNYFAGYLNQSDYLAIEVLEPVKEKPNSFEIIGRVLAMHTDSGFVNTTGKVRLYFSNKIMPLHLLPGSQVVIKNYLKPISAPKNPYQFNFKNYSAKQQIHYQGFVWPGQFKLLSSPNSSFLGRIYTIRLKITEELKNRFSDKATLAIVSSLLLGDRTFISSELKTSYIDAGIMHILAVSGLHVGIILLILLFLVKPLPNYFVWRLAKTVLAISVIASYAMLTGLAPSIQRAAVLFSFIAVGQLYARNANLYNLLAASAITLILFNPLVIFELGFQLSYAAVLGIITFHPKLEKLINPTNKIARFFWQIICVSFAAQLATFPISLYYFHQLPTYFLLSNLVAIPAAIIVLCGGIALICFSWLNMLANVIAYGLTGLVYVLNTLVGWFTGLPYAVITGVSVSGFELIILYLIIGLLLMLVNTRKHWSAYSVVGLSLVFLTLKTIDSIKHTKQKMLVVYAINNHSAIDFISGKASYLLHSFDMADSKQAETYVHPNWHANQININHSLNFSDVKSNCLQKQDNIIRFYGIVLIIIDSPLAETYDTVFKQTADYLIIKNNPKIDLSTLNHHYRFQHIIVDGSNHYKRRKKWQKQAQLMGVNLIDVVEEGAFILAF